MTAGSATVGAVPPAGPAPALAPSVLGQVAVLARRSVRRTFRQPASVVPAFVFPLLLLAINSAGLAQAVNIPDFPADSYLDFAIAFTFMQGSLFATTTAGIGLGEDIEGGFLDRLAMTPMHGGALVAGQLAGALVVAAVASVWYVRVAWVFGAEFQAGLAGIPVLLAYALGTAAAFASVGAYIALRAGTAEAVQGLFPLLFASLFLSSMSMPRELMDAEWFRTIATLNPVSYMVEAIRSLVIIGWDGQALAAGAAVIVAVLVVGLGGCERALRRRLTRT